MTAGERTAALPLDLDWEGTGPLHRYFVVDVFTDAPLEGNQLGVFTDGRAFSEERMQRLAREMSFSETVFVLPPEGEGDVRIRIFTPARELPFAGHPVLGTAFLVGAALGKDAVGLETGLGIVALELELREGRPVFGWMRQPVPAWQRFEREAELLAALGLQRSGLPVEAYQNGPVHVYVELESEAAVAALKPDLAALLELPRACFNCFAGQGRRWKTRVFCPHEGVPEDPATGSAAGPLAIHLARHGRIAWGDQVEIRQGAEINRPSVLHARADGSADKVGSVQVGGSAVVVARGDFRLGT